MIGRNRVQERLVLLTCLLSQQTARMKVASRGRIERTGHLTFKDNLGSFYVRMRRQSRRKQGLSIRMQRIRKKFFRRASFYNLTAIHDGNSGAHISDHS